MIAKRNGRSGRGKGRGRKAEKGRKITGKDETRGEVVAKKDRKKRIRENEEGKKSLFPPPPPKKLQQSGPVQTDWPRSERRPSPSEAALEYGKG